MEKYNKTHQTKKTRDGFRICLNKPKNFIYDVGPIFIDMDNKGNITNISCIDLPIKIINNMLDHKDAKDPVRLLEVNLMNFCQEKPIDKTLNTAKNDKKNSIKNEKKIDNTMDIDKDKIDNKNRDIEPLGKSYKFITHNVSNPNLHGTITVENISICIVNDLSITAECKNCKNIIQEKTDRCSKCKKEIGVSFIPMLEHGCLGHLLIKGCCLLMFNSFDFLLSCICEEAYKVVKTVGFENNSKSKKGFPVADFRCFSCQEHLKIFVENIYLVIAKSTEIQIGKELPDKGSCKHYKRSFRWFRFKCCGNVFPCDICHNINSNHKATENADRMICGLCSKEQSVKKECSCGMSLKSRSSKFWEGGKGNRNKHTMSKRDIHKFKHEKKGPQTTK